MSSDKDSVAPEYIWIDPADTLERVWMTIKISDDEVCYIRDDGDLIPRATVVKRLRLVADAQEVCGMNAASDVKAEWHFGRKQLANALAEEFEAADKDLELK